MGDVIIWAAIGGALALVTQRKSLAVLIGVVIAMVGTVVQASVAAAALAAAFGASRSGAPGGQSGFHTAAVVFCVVAFVACGLVLAGFLHALTTGSFWPRWKD